MKSNKLLSLLFLLFAIILGISCVNDNPSQGESQPLPDNYAYIVTLNCFCYPVAPFHIEILDGEIVSFESEEFDVSQLTDEIKTSFTIDNLHGEVLRLLDQDPFMSEVIPHPVYGFPADVFIDHDRRASDEEWGYTITEFRSL